MSFESRRLLRSPPSAPVRRLGGTGYELDAVQRNVEAATRKARALPQTKGRLVRVDIAAPGNIDISHGLGRKPIGYELRKTYTAMDLTFVRATSRLLVVTASAAGVVELWVY